MMLFLLHSQEQGMSKCDEPHIYGRALHRELALCRGRMTWT